MAKKRMVLLVLLVMVAFASPVGAKYVTFIHGLPALPGAVPSFNPVDINVDGQCQYIYKLYGSKLGPIDIEAGDHAVTFYENVPGQRCTGTVLGTYEWTHQADDEIDVVLGLNAEDEVAISVWDNKPSLALVDGGAEAVVEVRNAAAGPTLDALVRKGSSVVANGSAAPGAKYGPIETTQGGHSVVILRGAKVFGENEGSFQQNRVYWNYITGSVFKDTVKILSIESIPDQPSEGNPPSPPAFSTCCYAGFPAAVSQSTCLSTGGLYVGNVNPSPNPCP